MCYLIRESLHFHFAGRKSTDFDIWNVKIAEGLYNEQVVADRTINEIFIRGRDKPYFIDTQEEPKSLQLRFAFNRTWDDKLIDDVIRWLNVKVYKPLFFEGDIDRVFYAMPVDGIRKIHNGLKNGYLELNMRCDSGKSYSHKIVTPYYNTKELSDLQKTSNPIIKIGNKGHFSIYPKIWIEKIGDGDLLIKNKTNGNEEFKFVDIDKDEQLFIDCKNEYIETDKNRTYRYDNFNDNYLKLIYGENILTLSDNMRVKFEYRYLFS